MRNYLVFVLLFFYLGIHAQMDSLDYSRMPDKAFVHLDRNLYSPGDTIWLKAYAFHRNGQTLSDNSYTLHMQLLSPEGREVGTYKVLMVDGMGYGQIPLYEDMQPGIYQLISHTGHMKNFELHFFHRSTFEVREREAKSSIKVFFDRAHYRIGDTAKVSFHAYDEFHMPAGKMRFRYVLSHQGQTLEKGGLRCDDEGRLTKRFPITAGHKKDPLQLELSYYQGENTDMLLTQHITLPMMDDVIDVNFYPESGNLVEGLDTRIAFEAKDALGRPVEVKGILLEDGREMLELSTIHQGKGSFMLSPLAANYAFKVSSPSTCDSVFQLPKVQTKGYNLSYIKQDAAHLVFLVSHNFGYQRQMNLWVSQYDELLKVYEIGTDSKRLFHLSKTDLPEGIVTFTLIDDKNKPVAERLVYISKEDMDLAIETQEEIYGFRKKVKLDIRLKNGQVPVHLSLAVKDSVLGNSPWIDADNIKAYTLLSSELKGPIYGINSYLGNSKEAEQNRNLLLMTQGWERFNWVRKQLKRDSMQVHDFDYIQGDVQRRNKPVPYAKLTAMVMGGAFDFTTFSCDSNGQFRIKPNYKTRHSGNILFQAQNTNNKSNVKIRLINTDTLIYSYVQKAFSDKFSQQQVQQTYFVQEDNETAEEKAPFLSYESKLLKELVVYGERVDPEEDLYYSNSSTAFATGAMKGSDLTEAYNFADFVRQVSMRAEYDFDTDRIIVRELGGDAFSTMIADDLDSEDSGAVIYLNDMYWGKDVSALDFLTKEDILQIVVYDPKTAYPYYGSEGAQGVILVRTRELQERENLLNRNMAVFGRFVNAKKFYTQRYESEVADSLVVVDNRITLHWEPFVEIDESGHTSLEFYTDDISGTKQIVVQGLDDKGRLYFETKDFEVKGVGE